MSKQTISPESCVAVILANAEGHMSDHAFRMFVCDTLSIVENETPSITEGDIRAQAIDSDNILKRAIDTKQFDLNKGIYIDGQWLEPKQGVYIIRLCKGRYTHLNIEEMKKFLGMTFHTSNFPASKYGPAPKYDGEKQC